MHAYRILRINSSITDIEKFTTFDLAEGLYTDTKKCIFMVYRFLVEHCSHMSPAIEVAEEGELLVTEVFIMLVFGLSVFRPNRRIAELIRRSVINRKQHLV